MEFKVRDKDVYGELDRSIILDTKSRKTSVKEVYLDKEEGWMEIPSTDPYYEEYFRSITILLSERDVKRLKNHVKKKSLEYKILTEIIEGEL